MTAVRLLNLLSGVRQTGSDRYVARCPAHADNSPSLSIRETDDGRVLLHCFAGCHVESVLNALGLKFADLMPERIGQHIRTPRQPFDARQVLEGVSHEVAVIAVIAEDLVAGETLTEAARDRLLVAAGRLSAALMAAPVLPEPPEIKAIRSGERPS